MTNEGSLPWVEDSEKYALIGLSVKSERNIRTEQITPNLWILANTSFEIPLHWREWLGSIRVKEVEDCNLFLLSKQFSSTPAVLDAENQNLQERAINFYVGLLLASTFAPAHSPIMITGSRQNGEVDILQQQDFDCPIPRLFRPYPPVVFEDIQAAAQLGEKLDALDTMPPHTHLRLRRVLNIYTGARTNESTLDRIHQYCRCIEGLILPDIGKTERQFKSRTELFVGPQHQEMMGTLYKIRSAVEHLHEYQYIEVFDREIRLDLVKKEAIVEHIVRIALARIVSDESLWPHFADTSTLKAFWVLTPEERRLIWGDPVDPLEAVADFNRQSIHDGQLDRI